MAEKRKTVEFSWGQVVHLLITAALVWKVFGWQYGMAMVTPFVVALVLAAVLGVIFRKGA